MGSNAIAIRQSHNKMNQSCNPTCSPVSRKLPHATRPHHSLLEVNPRPLISGGPEISSMDRFTIDQRYQSHRASQSGKTALTRKPSWTAVPSVLKIGFWLISLLIVTMQLNVRSAIISTIKCDSLSIVMAVALKAS